MRNKGKKKHLTRKENNKFTNQLNFTPKEVVIKDKTIEVAKTMKTKAKRKHMIDTHKELSIL